MPKYINVREVLNRIDIKRECEAMGIQFTESVPNDKGWIACRNPYKKDENPSAGINVGYGEYRGCLKYFNDLSKGGESFWQLAQNKHPRWDGLSYWEIISKYADQVGVQIKSSKTTKPPSRDNVEFYKSAITDEIRKYLKNERGLTDESITKYEIGWSSRRKRLVYPVFDSKGNLVNLRFHAFQKNQKPKTQNWSGYGQRRLWGVDRLTQAPACSTISITEGEFDSMIIEQETHDELISVSPTNGKEAFDPSWVQYFHGHHVVLIWDCDHDGRMAVQKTVIPAFKKAVRDGDVLSFKIVWLFDDSRNKDAKDATDWFVKFGGSGEDLLKKIAETEPETFPVPKNELPEPIILESFEQINAEEYIDKRVQVDLYVFGENSETYAVPTQVIVGDCPGKNKKGCQGRADWNWSCEEPIPIQTGSRVQLMAVQSTDFQLDRYLQRHVCDKNQKPVIIIEDGHRTTLREIYAHQIETEKNAAELVEKPIYILSDQILNIGRYRCTGFVRALPKNQKQTIIVDRFESQEEDWQAFRIEQAVQELRKLKGYDLFLEILEDISFTVTRIYERFDQHFAVMLTLCSPQWIDMPGDGRIRGWVTTCLIGDTGTGKSDITQKILKYVNVGMAISGMTSSRTGITYACERDEKRGWRVKAGAQPKMNGQILAVDEAQDIGEEDLKSMADGMDKGYIKVDRIQEKVFKTATRLLFCCNPKDKFRITDQRTMTSFRFGCTAIQTVFPKMMVRRLDLVLPMTSHDVPPNHFNSKRPPGLKQIVNPENLRALIHYAWNLKPEQIVISESVADYIREKANELSEKFGACEDLPIVYPGDFRKTLCRLCAAMAILDLSTEDDFETIIVTKDHVDIISSWIDSVYSGGNFLLHRHSSRYKDFSFLDDSEFNGIIASIKEYMSEHIERNERMALIVKRLTTIPEDEPQKVSKASLASDNDVTGKTIQRDCEVLAKNGLVRRGRSGYSATDKMYLFINRVADLDETDLNYGFLGIK